MITPFALAGKSRGALLLAHICCVGCAGSAPAPAPPSAPSPLLEKPLPEFRRTALDGSAIETKSLEGRVVVFELFAEHCVPCVQSLPAAEAAHRARPDAMFVGLSEDDDQSGAERMVARYELTFPVVHDAGRVLAGRLRLTELPATVVADKAGTVRWVGTRAFTAEEITLVIDRVTTGRP